MMIRLQREKVKKICERRNAKDGTRTDQPSGLQNALRDFIIRMTYFKKSVSDIEFRVYHAARLKYSTL